MSIRKRVWGAKNSKRQTLVLDYYDQAGKRRRKPFKRRRNNNLIVRNAFLGLGVKIAPQVHAAGSVPKCQAIINQYVREALTSASQTSEAEVLQGIQREAARRGKRLIIRRVNGGKDHEQTGTA